MYILEISLEMLCLLLKTSGMALKESSHYQKLSYKHHCGTLERHYEALTNFTAFLIRDHFCRFPLINSKQFPIYNSSSLFVTIFFYFILIYIAFTAEHTLVYLNANVWYTLHYTRMFACEMNGMCVWISWIS